MTSSSDRLFKRSTVYYYRRRVSPSLRHFFKSKTFVVSLKTHNYSDAKRLASCYDSYFDHLTTRQIMDKLDISKFDFSSIHKLTIQKSSDGSTRIDLTPEDLLAMACFSPAQIQTVLSAGSSVSSVPVETKSYPLLAGAIDAYHQHRAIQKKTYKPAPNHNTFFRRLSEILGDIPVNEITRDKAKDVIKKLKQLPADTAKYRGLTVDQIISKNLDDNFLTVKSLNNHIELYTAFFEYLKQEIDSSLVNVFGGLRQIETDKERLKINNIVSSFTRNDLSIIFSSPRFSDGQYTHNYQFWTPLISLYTGARRAEIAQLYKKNIHQDEHGVWVFDINELEEDQKIKNAGAIRKTPIHPHLIDLGFLDFVSSVDNVRIFPELKTFTKKEGYGRNIGENFIPYIRKLGIDENKVFHSFRGTFSSELYRLGIEKYTRYRLAGREEGMKTTEEKHYLNIDTLFLLSELKKVDFSKELLKVKPFKA